MSPQPLRRRIGQLLIGSFTGPSIPVEMRSLAREFDLGGVIFLGRHDNIAAPDQVADLAFDARRLGGELPAWVSVDQEGGRVARLRTPFTEWPPMATLGRSDDASLAARFARALAVELTVVGISLDYAPVLDVRTNPGNEVIGDRAFGDQADLVARIGRIIVKELQAGGVAACGKHFPGHGDTTADSHFDLPVVEHPPDRLRAVEFVPFKAAIEEEVAFIMTAHVLAVALDQERPATLSPNVVHRILRQELGYQGVIVTDDLEMKAIAARYPMTEAAVHAISAGCDALLVCGGDVGQQAAMLEAVIHAVERGSLPLTRVDDALARQQRVKERFLHARSPGDTPSPLRDDWKPLSFSRLRALVGCDAHRAIADEMSQFA